MRTTSMLAVVPFALGLNSLNSSACLDLASLSLSSLNATVINSTYHAANTRHVGESSNQAAICEVFARVSYGVKGNNSLISAIWLPEKSSYQNRFMAVGNGGMAGTIDFAGMMVQINNGFGLAVAGGDSGHLASDNNNGGGAPGVYLPYLHDVEQTEAWIHNAISLFTPIAKTLIEAYYAKPPTYSYYYGCSTGGAQGFALAQYHPELFDGIYAGCPGNWYSHLALSFLWNAQHTNTSASNLTQAHLNLTRDAVLAACDSHDGVEDGVIENPLACKFDIESLACDASSETGSSADVTCLTTDQIAAAKAIYAGPKSSDTGEQLYPGFTLGSEVEWSQQQGPLSHDFSVPILQNLVFDDLNYTANQFNWASDVDALDREAGTLIDSIANDLSDFRERKGKLMVSQGWADPYNAATWPMEHLAAIEGDFHRLFMIPGGGHCGAAAHYPSVPATYHFVERLVDWVEKDIVPKEVLTTEPPQGGNTTRKLCPWPEVARYVTGDQDDWTSYVCSSDV